VPKLVPEASVQVDYIEWRPWADDRKHPHIAIGATGQAMVKVLSKDPESGAETLMYELPQGWSAEELENTVYENLMVLDGELEVDGETLRKYAYSYRPEGHRAGPISSATGAVVLAIAGAPGEPSSKIPVPHLDVEAMPWTQRPAPFGQQARSYIKMLRADEENLDTFYMARSTRGAHSEGTTSHDAPEESYFFEGEAWYYDGVTGGRLVARRGTYVHRGSMSMHGYVDIVADHLTFKHDYFNHIDDEKSEDAELLLAAYPKETDAVKALREGRDPGLPRRW
jgi:hypothetical protein